MTTVSLTALLFTGCGGGNLQNSSPAAESTTTTMSIDYQKQYQDLVAPSNAQLDVLEALPAGADYQVNYQIEAEKFGLISKDFANALLRARWPENARQAIQDFAEVLIQTAVLYSSVRSMSVTDFNNGSRDALGRASAKASVVRALLGMAPPP